MTTTRQQADLIQLLHARICALEGRYAEPDSEPGMGVYTHTSTRPTHRPPQPVDPRRRQRMLLDASRRAKARQEARGRTRSRWEKSPASYAHWDRDDLELENTAPHAQPVHRQHPSLDELELDSDLWRHNYPEMDDYYDWEQDEDNSQNRYDLYRESDTVPDEAAPLNHAQYIAIDAFATLCLQGMDMEYSHGAPVVTCFNEHDIKEFAEQNARVLHGVADTPAFRETVDATLESAHVTRRIDRAWDPRDVKLAVRNMILFAIRGVLL